MIMSYTKSMNTLMIHLEQYPTKTKADIEKGDADTVVVEHRENYSKVYDSESDTVYKYIIANLDNVDIKTFEKETGLEGVQDYVDSIENAESTQNVSLPHKTNEDNEVTQVEEDMLNNLADSDIIDEFEEDKEVD